MIHQLLIVRLHHHPQQGLGATGPHQHPAATVHGRLRRIYGQAQGFALLPLLAPLPVGHRHIYQNLGIGLEAAVHPASQALAGTVQKGGHLQGRKQPVATHAMPGRENMARLLAAETRPHLLHRLVHILIANSGALKHSALGLPGPLEAQIRHHGCNDPVCRQLTLSQ